MGNNNIGYSFDYSLPNSKGKSRYGAPVSAAQRIASINGRLSLAVVPESKDLKGKMSRISSHWSFRKSFRSILNPVRGTYTTKIGETN
jgi:hypothetical protein